MPLRIELTFTMGTGRRRDGGKPAARKLLKLVKPGTKRAAFLRWHLEDASGRTIGATMAHFGISRQNVLSHWTQIHREHGVGYALAANNITAILPAGADAKSIFKT